MHLEEPSLGAARTVSTVMLPFPLMSVARCPSRMGALPSCYGGKNEVPVVGGGSGTELRASLGRGDVMETLSTSPLS